MYVINQGSKSNELYMEPAPDGYVIKKLLFFKIIFPQYKRHDIELPDIVFSFGSKAIVRLWKIPDDLDESTIKFRYRFCNYGLELFAENKKDYLDIVETYRENKSVIALNDLNNTDNAEVIFSDSPESEYYITVVELINVPKKVFIQKMRSLEDSNISPFRIFYAPLIINVFALLLFIAFVLLNLHAQGII